MTLSTYFCPDCGWEGQEPICALCGAKTESLDVDPITGQASDEGMTFDDVDDLDEDWEEDDN